MVTSFAGVGASYFSTYASYPIYGGFAPGDDRGYSYLLLCRVVVGDFTKGNGDTEVPPLKPFSSVRFDSTVNDIKNPKLFAIFADNAAYPEYIIKYRLA